MTLWPSLVYLTPATRGSVTGNSLRGLCRDVQQAWRSFSAREADACEDGPLGLHVSLTPTVQVLHEHHKRG